MVSQNAVRHTNDCYNQYKYLYKTKLICNSHVLSAGFQLQLYFLHSLISDPLNTASSWHRESVHCSSFLLKSMFTHENLELSL